MGSLSLLQGFFPNPGMEPGQPALQVNSLPGSPTSALTPSKQPLCPGWLPPCGLTHRLPVLRGKERSLCLWVPRACSTPGLQKRLPQDSTVVSTQGMLSPGHGDLRYHRDALGRGLLCGPTLWPRPPGTEASVFPFNSIRLSMQSSGRR